MENMTRGGPGNFKNLKRQSRVPQFANGPLRCPHSMETQPEEQVRPKVVDLLTGKPAATRPGSGADSRTDTTPHVLPASHHSTHQAVTPHRSTPLGSPRTPHSPECAPGAGSGGRTAGAPPRESGRARTAAPGSAAWLLSAREPQLPEWAAGGARAAAGCGREPGGRHGPGRGVGREGAAAAPSPRPGAEQREAAQAAAGPAAARRPREAPKQTPGRPSLRLGSWARPGAAPRPLTWGEDSRDPGGPGRTAEMPQTDTAAILETLPGRPL
nr:dynein assembly factor 3, axonemal homolog [Rattus norvegicus]